MNCITILIVKRELKGKQEMWCQVFQTEVKKEKYQNFQAFNSRTIVMLTCLQAHCVAECLAFTWISCRTDGSKDSSLRKGPCFLIFSSRMWSLEGGNKQANSNCILGGHALHTYD